eukprot:5638811-Pyramimonas_sp.AAC.1
MAAFQELGANREGRGQVLAAVRSDEVAALARQALQPPDDGLEGPLVRALPPMLAQAEVVGVGRERE